MAVQFEYDFAGLGATLFPGFNVKPKNPFV